MKSYDLFLAHYSLCLDSCSAPSRLTTRDGVQLTTRAHSTHSRHLSDATLTAGWSFSEVDQMLQKLKVK